VSRNGSLVCWGDDTVGQSTPPAGSFEIVSVGVGYSCAVGSDGAAQCWGSPSVYSESESITPPSGTYREISLGGGLDGYAYNCACGILSDGSVVCWANCGTPPSVTGMSGISVGAGFACALDSAGQEWCWGGAVREPL
jgi:hypothetical protein